MARRKSYTLNRAVRDVGRVSRAVARAEARSQRKQLADALDSASDRAEEWNRSIEEVVEELGTILRRNARKNFCDPLRDRPVPLPLPAFSPVRPLVQWCIKAGMAGTGLGLILGLVYLPQHAMVVTASGFVIGGLAAFRLLRNKAALLEEKYEIEHEKMRLDVVAENERVAKDFEEFVQSYSIREPAAIEEYFARVLDDLSLPDDIHADSDLIFDGNQLTLEFELPSTEVIPSVESVKFVKSRREFTEKDRTDASSARLYKALICNVSLSAIHAIFASDQHTLVRNVVLNGYVDGIDPATGHADDLCLISVQVSRDKFLGLDLEHVDGPQCLKRLGARVSPNALDAVAVERFG